MKPREILQRVHRNMARAILGKDEAIRMSLIALLADGHVLIEDVPGVGKTLLAKALSCSVDCAFKRIQFTPDLLPSDILGSSIYRQDDGEFTFKPGPIFSHIILADEINRTTPRTQSALLEAMSDQQVSVDGETYRLEPPFMVLATQNPFEFEGTYMLPENQLDRFMMRIRLGYPDRQSELNVLSEHRLGEPIDALEPVTDGQQVLELQQAVREVGVEDRISAYILDLVEATRQSKDLQVGASPRAALNLYRAAQASALLAGRDYVVPDDVKALTVPLLAHRVIGTSFLQTGQTEAAERIIQDIVDRTPVPE